MSANEEEIETSELNCCEHYDKNGKAKTVLFAMLIGLTSDDGRPLGDTDVPPHKDAKLRKLFVPTTAHLRSEASRRCVVEGKDAPSCKHWNTDRLKSWLKENVIEQPIEIEWLKTQEKRIFDLHNTAEQEKRQKDDQCKDWGDLRAWCRLCCCLYHESVRPLLLSMNDVMDRQELDARNNEARPPTVHDAASHLFNDSETVFELPAMPDLHHVFAQPLLLTFDDMPGPITPDDAKSRLATTRAKLMRVISKWELSGNGFGQRAADDEEFGHMDEEQSMDGDDRARFLEGVGSEHLLVLWDLGDTEGVLTNVLNGLDVEVAIDCENIHTDTSEAQNPRRLTEQEKECKRFRDSLADSMKTMSCASLCQQLRESDDKIIKLKEQVWAAATEGALEFYESCLAREKERNEELHVTPRRRSAHRSVEQLIYISLTRRAYARVEVCAAGWCDKKWRKEDVVEHAN